MKYKALILDVDGTLIPNREDGMPSKKVTDFIAKIDNKIHVGIASSRPLFMLTDITSRLKLSGPSIINGGAQVIDIRTHKIYYRQPVKNGDVPRVFRIMERLNLPLYADTDEKEILISDRLTSDTILGLFVSALDFDTIDKLRKMIDAIPTLSSHVTPSWTKGKFTIAITHAKATKQHAIFEVAKILGINTHEIIGVGDGYNDFPLLMACGLKVAMGNAVDELKAIADYIAPTVEEDGVADVIEKFVLN